VKVANPTSKGKTKLPWKPWETVFFACADGETILRHKLNPEPTTLETTAPPELVAHRKSADVLLVKSSGNWRKLTHLPGLQDVRNALEDGAPPKAMEFDTSGLEAWSSRFVAFVSECRDLCEERHVEFRDAGLPEGVRGLLRLASAVPEMKDARRSDRAPSWLQRVGDGGVKSWEATREMLTFLGENVVALGKLVRGRAQFRWSDALLVMQECGPQALGIVALINFLVGLILAFVGAVGLRQFGASVFVADMVAIGVVREMGCLMTGIILCGRTGAAFAAQLGTMKVNQEISAFQTFGISPVEFLVLPRMIALVLMMPLLCVFADAIAIFGGFFVSVSLLDITATEYLTRTLEAIRLKSFLLGVCKGSFFGFLVAYTGCLRGVQCGNNAAAVGEATTRAVVAGITAIIASDGIFAVICNALKI
jgi:phospholipid/cholesterol/gamma-HCH transport system permease protein